MGFRIRNMANLLVLTNNEGFFPNTIIRFCSIICFVDDMNLDFFGLFFFVFSPYFLIKGIAFRYFLGPMETINLAAFFFYLDNNYFRYRTIVFRRPPVSGLFETVNLIFLFVETRIPINWRIQITCIRIGFLSIRINEFQGFFLGYSVGSFSNCPKCLVAN